MTKHIHLPEAPRPEWHDQKMGARKPTGGLHSFKPRSFDGKTEADLRRRAKARERMGDPIDRLRAKLIEHTDTTAGPDGCWPWSGPERIHWRGERRTPAALHHMVAFAFIPPGSLMRTCKTTACVNPSHREPGDDE